MEKLWPFLIVATGLWTAAAALAVGASLTGSIAVALWSALAAMKASVVTLWAIMENIASRERLRVEAIADLLVGPDMPRQRNVEPIRH